MCEEGNQKPSNKNPLSQKKIRALNLTSTTMEIEQQCSSF